MEFDISLEVPPDMYSNFEILSLSSFWKMEENSVGEIKKKNSIWGLTKVALGLQRGIP